MGLNETPSSERVHIGFFGRRNAGKSSLVNAITNQDLAVVSSKKGTTTDPVHKAMELLPLGPVAITDTPGFDDSGDLGELRVHKAQQTLNNTDIAVLVVDATVGVQASEQQLLQLFAAKKVNYLVVFNKADLVPDHLAPAKNEIYVSAQTGVAIAALKERLAHLVPQGRQQPPLVSDLLKPHDLVVLVTPIDAAAPKGRLILPQQMTIRDILDHDGICMVTKETELAATLASLKNPPAMVITDSQAFAQVAKITPATIPLTSFSILMARRKGILNSAVQGVGTIDQLQDGDKVLIAEGCTHHRQCGDIGSVKLPAWLKKRTGKKLTIELSSGHGFPEDLSQYALVIHCGGCMLNAREVSNRMQTANTQGIPMTNYGTAIAYMKGILPRSIAMLPEALASFQSPVAVTN
ncbi:[FeFe] hydrogenase H-cluster maturation GTPase HydF [Loigolactobacillus binensis]|uniref:[FeFe] hydrogenase H-cluster maturation GTPase HydF n=1 Tax=Loigolactobacillus binensis TaxID=2559922 RepID=A0ABW3E824_9LACO|nr:[FeFe] hydrogenase H-cluster maturation GTPase HydF [Loigolactobacillus binensis]